MTLIALTSQNRRQITEHAGKCRKFLVYEVNDSQIGEPRLIELPLGGSQHDLAPGQPHPLDEVDILISASMGDGLRVKLARRGIQTILTDEAEPLLALQRYIAGELTPQDIVTHEGGRVHHEHHSHGEDEGQGEGHGSCGHCGCAHAGERIHVG